MTRTQRAALACSALLCLVRCDCEGSIADAGHDASTAVVDANGQIVDAGRDAGPVDHQVPDLAPIDRGTSDHATVDSATADGGPSDAAANDTALSDAAGADVVATDSAAEDSGSSPPDCTDVSGLCVKLTWNTDLTDLDLHLVYDGTTYCTDDSCYWANCKDGALSRTDWDGVSGVTAGDPTIFGDDTIGFGPEVIKIEQELVGTYVVGVYFNQPTTLPETAATVELYDHGDMVTSYTRTLSPDDFWEVIDIFVNSLNWDWNAQQRECVAQQPCGQTVDTCPLIN